MPPPPRETLPAPRWWHAAAVFLGAVALFLLLPQRGVHGVDGNVFAVWIEEGDTSNYARHAAYLHLCGLAFAALEPFGASGHDALRLTSALGTALGLVFLLFAFARLAPPHVGGPLLPVLAVLFTPTTFYFATTGEIAGVFAAGVGLLWWTFARWLDRPSVATAACLGVAAAIAGALHALGHLMTPALLAAAALLRRLPAGRRGAQLVALVAAHAAVAVILSMLLTTGAGDQAADAADVIGEYWETFAPLTAPAVLFREWLLPYLPWSVGALLALSSRRSRPFALATLAMLALYLPPNVVFLGFHEIRESGAYFLPLGPLLVLATAQFVSARGFVLVVVIAATVTVLTVAPGWRHPVPPDFGAGVELLNTEQKVALVVGSRDELAGARTAVKGLMVMEFDSVVGAWAQIEPPAARPPFAEWFDGWHDTLARGGSTTVFSELAVSRLDADGYPLAPSFWHEHVPARYELTDVQRRGFRGVVLRRR